MTTVLSVAASRLGAIRAQQAELKQAESDVLAKIRDLIGAEARGVIEDDGHPVIEVSYGKRFNADVALNLLAGNPELLASVQETTISAKLAKAVLAPAVYELCQAESASPTIKVVS